MKTLAVAIMVASGISASAGAAQLSYTITELRLPWDYTFTQPIDLAGLTKQGTIAGRMIDGNGWVIFLWAGADAQVLATVSDVAGFFAVRGVNRKGQVVGGFTGGTDRALLWSAGATQDLGTLGGSLAAAYGINDHGDIVGAATVAGDRTWHPFLYQKGGMVDLGSFGGTDAFALAINNKRQVALDLQSESGHRLAIYDHGHL